jgi:molybdopterin converting factor small subunit
VDDNCSTGEAFDHVLNRFPQLSSHKLLFALNQEYVSKNARMGDADELAIFTAVSGG